MAGQGGAEQQIVSGAITELAKYPPVVVALFFMWLNGIVLSFVFIDNNSKFQSGNNQKSWFFNLALGFLPGSIVMIAYHAFSKGELLSTLEGLNESALPAVLILSGISCVAVLFKVMK
ncbi:hypothetical protein EX463_20050 [Vibrio alginolyticus]|nr:hypothetical protein [Vibrio alginolyticus]